MRTIPMFESEMLKALRENRERLIECGAHPEAIAITDREISRLSAPVQAAVLEADALEAAALRIRTEDDQAALSGLVEIFAKDIVPKVVSKLRLRPPYVDMDEAMQVGREVAADAIRHTWSPGAGRALRSWIWLCVERPLMDLAEKERNYQKRRRPLPQNSRRLVVPPAERAVELQEFKAGALRALAEFMDRLEAEGSKSLRSGVKKGHERSIDRAVRMFSSELEA